MKILLVDDDNAILDSFGTWLKTIEGFEVVTCNVPKEALILFRQAASELMPFDVVLTDFNMPGWSGLTLAMYINSCCTVYGIKVPIICITGNPTDVKRMNDRDRGPLTLVLEKGCPLQDVVTAINCVTQRAKGASA